AIKRCARVPPKTVRHLESRPATRSTIWSSQGNRISGTMRLGSAVIATRFKRAHRTIGDRCWRTGRLIMWRSHCLRCRWSISVLCALLLPALASSKENGKRARCVSNLRQLTLAAEMYWDENEQRSFHYLAGNTNGGAIYWFGWIKPGAEGEREFDATYGALYPYVQGRGAEICPSLNYGGSIYKLTAQ